MAHIVASAQFRLANYYLTKLRTIETTFKRGHEHSIEALAQFDQDWSQIKRWRAWAADHANEHDDIATIGTEYAQAGAEFFLLRLHPHERLEWLEAGLAAANRLGDTHAEMIHQLHLGRTYSYLGSVAYALRHTERAMALAQQLDDQIHLCRSLITLGGIYYGIDEYEKSRQTHEQALQIGIELGAKHEIGTTFNGLGNVAFSQADYERAYDCYMRSMEILDEAGIAVGVCMALRNLSMVTKRMGDTDAATSYAKRCVELCREVGYQSCLAETLSQLGLLAYDRDQLAEARDYYEQSLDLSRQISHPSNEAYVLYRLGCLVFKTGDIPEALEYFEAAAALSQEIGERWFAAIALMNLAEVLRAKGEIQQACRKLHEGWEIAATLDGSAIRAKYLAEAARLWLDLDQAEQAAIWVGLLSNYVEKLMGDERKSYENLRQALITELSPEQFAVAMACGQNLDLDSEIEKAMSNLVNVSTVPVIAEDNPHPVPSL